MEHARSALLLARNVRTLLTNAQNARITSLSSKTSAAILLARPAQEPLTINARNAMMDSSC